MDQDSLNKEARLKHTNEGDLAMLVLEHKQFLFKLEADKEFQTHEGFLHHNDLIGIPWGSLVDSHLGVSFMLLEPSLRDALLHIRRHSQIIYPKDIGYILLRLSIGPNKTVIEAGTGSGAFTTALAWAVGSDGKVNSYDKRADMQELAQQNLEKLGLSKRVSFQLRDIGEGFLEKDADSLFLDLPNPEDYLVQSREALSNGGTFGAIVPTMNQVSKLLYAMEKFGFGMINVCETMLRFYKTVPNRMRPLDRMVAHTGYLIFARPIYDNSPSEAEEDMDFTDP
jgi:tRNA (adenine57-N1/adenine58-N1)-methyltransferase